MSGGFPALPPKPHVELPLSSTENIYETIRDNEPPCLNESLSKNIQERTSGETMTEKLDLGIAEDIYATIPDMKTLRHTTEPVDMLVNGANQFSSSALLHTPPQGLTEVDGHTSGTTNTEQIIDESGYLQHKQDNEPDFSIFAMAFPTESNNLTNGQSNLDQRCTERHLVDDLSDPKLKDQMPNKASVDDMGYLMPLEDLQQDTETPYASSVDNCVKVRDAVQEIPITSTDVGNDAHQRIYYSPDDYSSEGRKYYDIGPSKASQGSVKLLEEANNVGSSATKEEPFDEQGYLVPGVEEYPRPSASMQPFCPVNETSNVVPQIPENSDISTTKRTFRSIYIDKVGDTLKHTYCGMDDFSEGCDLECPVAIGNHDKKYCKISQDANGYSGSEQPNNRGHDTEDTGNSFQHLIDDLGYLVLTLEETENAISPNLRILDDSGYLLPSVGGYEKADETLSSSIAKEQGETESSKILHSYFGFKDSLKQSEKPCETVLSSMVRGERETRSSEIFHSYFGFKDAVEDSETADETSSSEIKTEAETGSSEILTSAHSPSAATNECDDDSQQIRHSYFGFRDVLEEGNNYPCEVPLGNDGGKVQRNDSGTSSLSLAAAKDEDSRPSILSYIGGFYKEEKEDSSHSSLHLSEEKAGSDEIEQSYFGSEDVLKERQEKHQMDQEDYAEEQGTKRSASSPSREGGNIGERFYSEIPQDNVTHQEVARYRFYDAIDSHVSIPPSDGSHSPSFQHTYLDFNDLQEQQSKETLHNYEMVEERGKLGDGKSERKEESRELDDHGYLVLDEKPL